MMEKISTTCLIAGGGPAGIMCGYLLARSGIDVTVLEKHGDFLRDFRGDTVHPSTMQIMQELGLLEKFLKLPHTRINTANVEIGERRFVIGDFTKLSVCCNYVALMPQWDFLNFLSDEAKKLPNFHLLMQTQAKDLIAQGDRIAGVLATGPEGHVQIRAGLTIAADGRHSILRAKSALPLLDIGAAFDVLWLRLPASSTDPRELIARVKAGQFLVMIYRTDYWQCAYLIPKGGFDIIRTEGLTKFRARLKCIAGFAADRVDEAIVDFDQIKLLTVAVNRLKKWARPGFLCIGDAAHAMSPIGGVGINLAIQDAVACANIVGPSLTRGLPKSAPVDKVQRRREFPTKIVQFVQVSVQNALLAPILKKGETPPAPKIIEILDRFSWLRQFPARLFGIGPHPEHVKLGTTGIDVR